MLRGKVVSGVGEGGFFMSLEPYVKEMEKELGYRSYPGTLNVAAKRIEAEAFIKGIRKVRIPGFTKGIKTFGHVDCYPCTLKGIPVAIIVPEFTRYELSTVEIIAREHLRTVLKLKDGDEVALS